MSEGDLEKKVRFETELEREEAIKLVREAGFRVIPMKYNKGLFGEYAGPADQYEQIKEELGTRGIRVIYRETEVK